MRTLIDSLVDGVWLTQPPTYRGQPIRITTYFDDGTFGVVETVNENEDADMRVTRLAFKQRFTTEERIAIRDAAQTNPLVYDFEDLVNAATYIDLQRSDTINAVNAIEQAGLIAEGRAVEILTAPITDIERYRGEQ
jgi:hypothetical protein